MSACSTTSHLKSESVMTMNLPETVEWLYGSNGAIHPVRRTDLNLRCQRSCPNADRNGGCSNACCSRDPRIDGIAINRETSTRRVASDGGASCSREAREASSNGEDGSKEDVTADWENGKGADDQPGGAPVGDDDERLGWQEEKKRWMRAAGVSTPFDLQRRIDDLRQAAGESEPDLKKLARDVTEVKTFLLRLHAVGERCTRRKRSWERSSGRRKRARRRCAAAMECYSDALSDGHQQSFTARAPEPGRGCLLDPDIMRSFGSLAEPSAGCNVRCAPSPLPAPGSHCQGRAVITNSRVMVPRP